MKRDLAGCRGCLIWMTCICAGLVLVVGGAICLGYVQLSTLKHEFTQPMPVKLPVVAWTSNELQALDLRLNRFLHDTGEGSNSTHLSLSEKEVNTLVCASSFSNLAYVTISNSLLRAQLSIPVESLPGLFNRVGVGFLRGRYLNGEGSIGVAATDGALSVMLNELSVNGRPLPEHYMARIRRINWVTDAATNLATRNSLRRISRIAAAEGTLILEAAPTTDPIHGAPELQPVASQVIHSP